ncbi:class I SAM-dependent methyltransferase [Streptomyces sp. NPDC006743]|uniref:class I SAM-dependent methyltransferase n=1 Tax=Streptomyces sp. NPDC006743 TaxID=3154480 RepID=UPI003456620F
MPPCSTAGSGRAGRDPVRHPLFARCYARFSVAAETRLGMAGLRERLLAGLTGRVIEIGAGNGLNFAHYPGGVAEVVAIEPERLLRHKAVAAALRADVPVDVVPGCAEALPVKSEAFDAVVFSLVLCSVHDVSRALAEARRVLRPGGEVRFFEHGVGGGRVMGLAQRALDRTVWPPLSGGCHLSRDPVAALRAAGFVLGPYRRVLLPQTGPVLPSSYCALGTAWRPAADGRRNPGDGPGPGPRSRAAGEPGAGGRSGAGP